MRIAVIGHKGHMGRFHYQRLQRDHLVVGADLGDDLPSSVDAAIIASPTDLHYGHAMHYIERGVPVLIEKPIAASIWQARHIVNALQPNHTIAAVGYVERFNPAWLTGREYFRDADFGLIERYGHEVPNNYGNVATDLMSHDIDLLRHLYGGFVEFDVRESFYNNASMTYRATHDTGKGSLIANRTVLDAPQARRWTAYGETTVVIDMADMVVWVGGKRLEVSPRNKIDEMHGEFLGWVRGRSPVHLAVALDGLRALEVTA